METLFGIVVYVALWIVGYTAFYEPHAKHIREVKNKFEENKHDEQMLFLLRLALFFGRAILVGLLFDL